MTPKKKALELALKFRITMDWTKEADLERIKECALICVDEILKSDPLTPSKFNTTVSKEGAYKESELIAYEYWTNVKQELEKL